MLELSEVDLLGIGQVFIEGADRALEIAVSPASPVRRRRLAEANDGEDMEFRFLERLEQAGANEGRLARARGRIEDNDALRDQQIAELKELAVATIERLARLERAGADELIWSPGGILRTHGRRSRCCARSRAKSSTLPNRCGRWIPENRTE